MEFDRFSTQSFEQLAQTLCMKLFGPGTVIFGAGPDGGREATFDGEIAFPSTADPWRGYTVVQAKCRERLRKDETDISWLETQLNREFNKYQQAKRKLKRPQNYLLITNVDLSSVPDVGGKARIDAVFESHRASVGFGNFATWSADELRALLSNAPDIRRTFTAWLTPSDVLDVLLKAMAKTSVQSIITLALSRDIRDERDARLRDAGQEPENAVFLESVFIDLPLIGKPGVVHGFGYPGFDPDERTLTTKAVARLIARSRSKLDPSSVNEVRRRKSRSTPLNNRIVILGGPGQGKSTIGQFFSQFLRANILSTMDENCINTETTDIIDAVLKCVKSEGLPENGSIRYPVRVDLPKFADYLAKISDDEIDSALLTYMAIRVAKSAAVDIDGGDMREWLGKCPTAVILDGLDEVPPSGNRKAVLKAVNFFWDDVALVQADTLVVVTSRPQGYDRDLDPSYWEHWELASLDKLDAGRFAERLSTTRISDPERREAVMNEIDKALEDPATRLLMTSPLQVSIIFGIALLKGAIPHDRWDLFNRYYTLLRDREAAKPGPIAALFREHRTRIDLLHFQAGFLLQVAAEVRGNADCYLTTGQFRILVEKQLEIDEFESDRIKVIADDLVRLSTQRLVLLVTRVEGRVTFEVRSLQEFMAAAQITSMSLMPLAARLRPVAASAHWRHVVRIAVSRVFSEAGFEPFRDQIAGVCDALDSGDLGDFGRACLAGARLSGELIADGSVAATPRYRRQFARRALKNIDLVISSDLRRLAEIADITTTDIYKEEILVRINGGGALASRGAWRLLFLLAEQGCEWASSLIIAERPSGKSRLVDLPYSTYIVGASSDLLREMKLALYESGPAKALDYLGRLTHRGNAMRTNEFDPTALYEEVMVFKGGMNLETGPGDSFEAHLIRSNSSVVLSCRLKSIQDLPNYEFRDDSSAGAEWDIIRKVISFSSNPNKESLAEFIDTFNEVSVSSASKYIALPWVLQTLLAEFERGTSKNVLKDLAKGGEFGDYDDWTRAEERWRANGISSGDIATWASGFYLNRQIGEKGAPYLRSLSRNGLEIEDISDVLKLIEVAKRLGRGNLRTRLLEAILFSLDNTSNKTALQLFDDVLQLAREDADKPQRAERLIKFIVETNRQCWNSSSFLEYADQVGRRFSSDVPLRHIRKDVYEAVTLHPEKRGLLVFLAAFLRYKPDSQVSSGPIDGLQFDLEESDTPVIKQAVAQLRILTGNYDISDIDELVEALIGCQASLSVIDGKMLGKMKSENDVEKSEVLAQKLTRRLQSMHYADIGDLSRFIAGKFESKLTGLDQESVAKRYDLPFMETQ